MGINVLGGLLRTDKQTDRQTQTDGRTQTDRQTDRQCDSSICDNINHADHDVVMAHPVVRML